MKTVFNVAVISAALVFLSAGKIEEDRIELKKIEKALVKVSDSLYACKHETTNCEYRIFLKELKAQNKMDDYKVAVIDSEQWQKRFPYAYHDPMTKMYGWHPAYDNYPVLNISHEGAELFCAWMTEKYNSWKNRNFKKVRFRLPNDKEWETAARGGKELENYPFGNYLRGDDGNLLCNFRPMGDERITSDIDSIKFEVISNQSVNAAQFMLDGATYTTPVYAYWPNGFGIHNMSGNVAEMVAEKGIARGGSWCNTGYDVRIDSKMSYDGPSPLVGFRYFMEVIER